MNFGEDEISRILSAAHFAAGKHKNQRRKGEDSSPYINHPLKVAEILWRIGEVRDVDCVVAGLLHDTLEDTDTTASELEKLFGSNVRRLVEEVTDDKTLPKQKRKELQIEHASTLSSAAKQIKLADKIANIFDVAFAPAPDWSRERRIQYLDWAKAVIDKVRGCNGKLEAEFDTMLQRAMKELDV